MILALLIVVPCAIVGIGVVTLLDRTGTFSGFDGGAPGGAASGGPSSGPTLRLPRVALIGGLVVMGAWVLGWIVVLAVGLAALLG